MRKGTWLATGLSLGVVLAFGVSSAIAQSNPIFVPLPARAKALLYLPDSNPTPEVGVLTVHRTGNKFTATECTELSRRGFAVLCLNTRFENNEAMVEFEKIALDLKAGVEYLKQRGVTTVLLYGHSGGGATTTFYQAVAEAGPSYCQGPNKLTQCDNSLEGLPPADGMLLMDGHPSNASKHAASHQPGDVQRRATGSGGLCSRSIQSCQRLQSQRCIALPRGVRQAIQRSAVRNG